MKLIVVTAPTFFVEEDKIITALFEEGLDILHLRKPETPAMYSERLLTLIPEKYHRRIVTPITLFGDKADPASGLRGGREPEYWYDRYATLPAKQ